ncbi:hypothetical protein AYX13_03067 [Cryptococcus neoformans]|nr:hypothetical protein AYX13_03067 [Cryptococcus neoformans var. grubii]
MAGPKPNPTNTLPQAYKLVHQILSSAKSGLHTKDIVKQGVALYADRLPPHAFEIEEPVDERKHKGKKKHVPEPKLVPQGHPFISTNFLKHHVLPTLQSQNLIHKHVVPLEDSEAGPSTSSKRGQARRQFVWSLRELPEVEGQSTSWSYPEHWQRLLSGAHPKDIGAEHKGFLEQLKKDQRRQAVESGAERRTEEEIWAWEDRKMGVTTQKERGHLNKRRELKRPEKEWKRYGRWEQLFRDQETATV